MTRSQDMVDVGMLAIKWAELRREQRGAGHALPAGEPGLEAWLALTESGGLRVLLALADDERDPVVDVGRDGALRCNVQLLTVGGSPRRCIDLSCGRKALDEVFHHFTFVLLRLRAELRASATVEAAIREFCDLLGLTGEAGRHRNLGDLGELLVLSWLQDRNPAAVEAWTGPATGRHDFRSGPLALEVKSGLRPQGKVTIARLDQLEPPEEGELWLVVLTFEADPLGDLTVAGMARRVDARIPSGAQVQPEARAKLDVAAALGEVNAYSLYEARVYRITEDTPRLRSGMLVGVPEAVRSISYVLGLEHLEPWRLPPGDHDRVWERLA